jgi:hypothetical protein
MKRLVSVLVGVLLIVTGAAGNGGLARAAAGAAAKAQADRSNLPLPLKVVGNRILNSRNESVILRGVNCPSLEWTSDGQGHILQNVNTAIRDWHANIIRLPLAQDRWFGKTRDQQDRGLAYRALVKEIVETCAAQSCYIILDLHWSDCGEWGATIGQHSMPDRNSVTFWTDCASDFKNHPAVIFDLYNEPHNVPWNVWLNGGTITDRPNTRSGGPPKTFEAVGMQKLLDTVRATGAKNVVIAGGLNWAYDFSGILEGIQLFDREGNGVIYANHAYDNKGESVDAWIAEMEKATAAFPVIVSEVGGSGGPHRRLGRGGGSARTTGDDWLLHVMQALQDHNWSWTAWSFHTSARPTLISDWTYTATPDFGVFVKQALAGTLPRYTPPAPTEPRRTASENPTNATQAPQGPAPAAR